VDDVARTVTRLVDEDAAGARVTLGRGPDAPTVGDVVERAMGALNVWRKRWGVEPVDIPPFVDPERWNRFFRRFLSGHVGPRHRVALELLDAFLPYLVLRTPLAVDEVVGDVLGPLETCVAWWADARPARAASTPRPWSSLVDDEGTRSSLVDDEEGAA